eukprot:XP_012820900.1 PREDICTED: uncharacterized protein LOC105947655 [Xenopus tropicalis]
MSEPLSTYMDYFLQPIVKGTHTYIRDTGDLLLKLQNLYPLPPTIKLATMDVSSLYTVIPTIDGIENIRSLLATHPSDRRPPIEFLMEILMYCYYFKFEQSYYLQISGTSMGSNVAPSFANLYMAFYEQTHILPVYGKCIHRMYRFIDDLLLLWTGTENQFFTMVEDLNQLPSPIRFTAQIDKTPIVFLDLKLTVTGPTLTTTTHRKETDRNTLLHFTSCHPTHTLQSIPYSQMVRMVRNNSDPVTLQHQLGDLKSRFIQRGYKPGILDTAEEKISALTQATALEPKSTSPQKVKDERLIFTTTYTPDKRPLVDAIFYYWSVLEKDRMLPPTVRGFLPTWIPTRL